MFRGFCDNVTKSIKTTIMKSNLVVNKQEIFKLSITIDKWCTAYACRQDDIFYNNFKIIINKIKIILNTWYFNLPIILLTK